MKHLVRQTCLMLLLLCCVPAMLYAETPVKDKVAVLITGWGMPAGYNFHYAWTSSDYARVGDIAEDDTVPCKIGHYPGPAGKTIHIGIIPWALHSGNLFPCDSDSLDGDNQWELFADYTGIYQYDSDTNMYISIAPEAPPVNPASLPAGTPIVPLKDVYVVYRPGLTYAPDPRDGSDYVSELFRIGSFSYPHQNGILDLIEGGPAYYMRYVGFLGGPDTLPDAYLPPPEELSLNHEVETLLYNDFGDRIDIRHGAYSETKCDSDTGCEDIYGNPVGNGDTIFPLHDDVAEDFAYEGFRKMLLTRETTDFNKYAVESMTGNYIKERLCELDVLDDMEINFSRQVGRTPEFNAMNVQNMQPYLEKYPEGSTIAMIYVTRGLPWEITNGTDCFGNQFPFCQEVYFENAYLNYLSWKKAVTKAYGSQYNLVFTKDGNDNDTLAKNLFTFSLETADLMGVEGEQVFLTTRDGIQLAKAQGLDKIIVVPAHWNYDNLDTIMRSKEENWLPITPKADVAAGNFAMTHCETAACDMNADTDTSQCGYNTDRTRNYSHIVECTDPDAVAEITFMPAYSNMYDKFAVAYYVVLRGALERFGLYPSGENASEVGAPDIAASQLLTKLSGGTVAVSDPASPVNGASIVVPADPYPLYPDTFTCDGGEDVESPNPPNPADTYEAMWEDTVITVGHLVSPPPMTKLAAAGPAVYFGPYRNFFNRDATLTIPYDADTAGDLPVNAYVYNHLTGQWEEIQTEGYENGLVTFKTQYLGLFQAAVAAPSQIDLKLFEALKHRGGRKVVVRWKTFNEDGYTGFNLYRNVDGGKYIQLNAELIPAKGTATKGGRYRFVDKELSPERTYSYRLEALGSNGAVFVFGPLTAVFRRDMK